MKWSLNLGTYAGIKVRIHWTFLILIVWIVMSGFVRQQTATEILWTIAFVLAIFLCVVLHEFGHALTAKRYNITTRDITLLPIGGIARLERMPEEPGRELLIAIAGPLVNLVIAGVLLLLISVTPFFVMPDPESTRDLSLAAQTFPAMLASVNVLLFAFNLIPAFPMDGGRIFRALLSFKLDRLKATRIAAVLGQIIAIGFVFIGLFYNPFLILIGIFVYLGAQFESKMVQSSTILKGYTVKDAMMNKLTVLSGSDTLDVAVKNLLNGQETEFLVTSNGSVDGVITRKEIIKGLSENGKDVMIDKIMNKEVETLKPDMPLTDVMNKMQIKGYSILPVVDETGKLVGSLDLDNIMEFVMVHAALERHDAEE